MKFLLFLTSIFIFSFHPRLSSSSAASQICLELLFSISIVIMPICSLFRSFSSPSLPSTLLRFSISTPPVFSYSLLSFSCSPKGISDANPPSVSFLPLPAFLSLAILLAFYIFPPLIFLFIISIFMRVFASSSLYLTLTFLFALITMSYFAISPFSEIYSSFEYLSTSALMIF